MCQFLLMLLRHFSGQDLCGAYSWLQSWRTLTIYGLFSMSLLTLSFPSNELFFTIDL